MNKAVFLDRDGTIIPDFGYLATVEGIDLSAVNGRALAQLAQAGFLLVVATNQSGIGRGYFTEDIVRAQHHRLASLARRFGVEFAGFAFCPHLPETDCDCRKPHPGMILGEARRLHVALASSFMVGDKLSDVQAGAAAGCRTILLADEANPVADWQARNFAEAVAIILAQSAEQPPSRSHAPSRPPGRRRLKS